VGGATATFKSCFGSAQAPRLDANRKRNSADLAEAGDSVVRVFLKSLVSLDHMGLAPVPVPVPYLVASLRQRFEELGITREALRQRTEGGDDLKGSLTPTRQATFKDDSLSVAVRFFFCGSPETPVDLELVLGPTLFLAACDAGLFVEGEDQRWVMPFHLRPVRGLWLFSDYLGLDAAGVMGADETTGILFEASYQASTFNRILDLGCGAGTLALLLADRRREVIGTDINPRAIALARWNAALNGLDTVEFRQGNLFEPVATDQPFDLIVSQPPYYPAPEEPGNSLTYLHGGQRGDELATQILDEVSGRLSTGGRALVFTSWPIERPRVAPPGMRGLELTTNRREPHGTRQSLNVLEHSTGSRWTTFATFAVPPTDWDQIRPSRIDSLLEADDLSHSSREALHEVVLRLPQGITMSREDDDIILHYPPQALVGTIQIDEPLWRTLTILDSLPTVGRALAAGIPESAVRYALERGLVMVRQTPSRSSALAAQP
jgi:SAM-dependent methyltransferase